jgi:hypothetical protein
MDIGYRWYFKQMNIKTDMDAGKINLSFKKLTKTTKIFLNVQAGIELLISKIIRKPIGIWRHM